MVKAGALYFSIVVAFFIAIISASVIMLAAHYRASYLKELRMARLQNNLKSGWNLLLTDNATQSFLNNGIDLYGDQTDSVYVSKKQWGLYDLATVKAFIQQDTLKQAGLLAVNTEQDALALYLSDEDRPLSVSGDTRIRGNVEVPKSGMRKSYVDGKPYTGDEMVFGKTSDSKRQLKGLEDDFLKPLSAYFEQGAGRLSAVNAKGIKNSFLDSTQIIRLAKGTVVDAELEGNIIIQCDSALTISKNAKLDQVMIFASTVKIESGFQGNCQVFAKDSIVVGNQVKLNYPSALVLISAEKLIGQAKIVLGNTSTLEGVILSYEANRSSLQTQVDIGEKSIVKGEIYCSGIIKMASDFTIQGKVSCNRFLLQRKGTLYENFLVDAKISRPARSKYYLSSRIFTGNSKEKKLLTWLK
ncbi:hypothetical protein ACJVDH_05925 [Pedobacter sp. AW1-32]|uniref:hypothetical protein n=1 Tax=Pedobacter sp. AW1-32 TaxID=3383026 RepID=UPI003FEF6560